MNYVVLICAVCMPFFLFSQEADTVVLDDLLISGKEFQRFSNGGNHEKIILSEISGTTLEQALSWQNSIYFRSYGNQQLSSIVFRGASAAQTNLLWHGIPANYATLGQMDFSQWPAWFLESMALEPGSGGALYGSGSIGGTVLLDSDLPKVETGAEVKSSLGSFGHQFYGVKAGYRVGKFSGQTKLFTSNLNNNFPYVLNGSKVRQPNAAVRNQGLQQEFGFQFGHHSLQAVAQFTENIREIQPSIFSPDNTEDLRTLNARMALVHQFELPESSLTTTLAYLGSDQLYDGYDRTKYDQISLASAYWKEVNEVLTFRVGTNINRYTAEADHYPNTFIDYQSAVFGSAEVAFSSMMKATVNLRQSFYKTNAPFTPSLGLSSLILNENGHQLKLRGLGSTGFRFPTLNDLHWRPGGNPDLLPERSKTLEGGVDWDYASSVFTSNFSLATYKTWSKNWIVWLPTDAGYFAPQNFRKVDLQGLEAQWKVSRQFDRIKQTFAANYSLNFSSTTVDGDIRQMPYTPYHLVSGSSSTSTSFVTLTINTRYTGARYVTLDNTSAQSVNGFWLVDAGVYGNLELGSLKLVPAFQVLNAANSTYENQKSRAMPGRNYQISLTLKI